MTVIVTRLVLATYTTMPNAGGARGSPEKIVQTQDTVDGGSYQVTGTVKITPSSPAHRKVTLFDAVSRILIREQWSDPVTGVYEFKNIRAGKFFVIAVDYAQLYNAVIADNISAEPMP